LKGAGDETEDGKLMTAGLRILVADDDGPVRDMIADCLTEAGYEVAAACDGAQALVEIDNGPDRFRALVTDIRMGEGPDGWHIARRARELEPDIPVIYLSGDSAADWTAQGVPNSVMIDKPFTPSQVATALATLLNRADHSIG
jgi:CheY-like chemotaxis protein